MPRWRVKLCFAMSTLFYFPFSPIVYANSTIDQWLPRCGGTYGRCGYVERGSDKVVMPFRFEVTQPFSEGLAAVRVDGRFGYINREGKLVIPPRFTAAAEFQHGFAEVRQSGASGIIDHSGRVVIRAKFRRITALSRDVFIAQPLDGDRVTDSEPRLSPTTTMYFSFFPNGSSGLFHRKKGWITRPNMSFQAFDEDSGLGLIWAAEKSRRSEEKWGLLRFDGKWQITPRFSHVQVLQGGRAIVRGRSPGTEALGASSEDLWGAVDRDGRLAIPLRFKHLSYWRAGYGKATNGGPVYDPEDGPKPKEAIVRPDGTLLGGRYFDAVDIPEDGPLPRARVGKRWYSVQKDGRLIADQREESVLLRCPGGLLLLWRGDKVEFRHERLIGSIGLFDYTYQLQRDCAGTMPVRSNGLWSFVTQDGRHIGGRGFTNTYSFSGQHAIVEVDGKWGIINQNGEFTVQPHYKNIKSDRGAYRAQDVAGEHWIDAQGRSLSAPPVAEVDPGQLLQCAGGFKLFDQNGLWGIKTDSGKVAIPPKYRALSCFANGVAWAAKPGSKRWCAVRPDGTEQSNIKCQQTYYPYTITESGPEPFADDAFESSVLWNRAYLDYASRRRPEPPKWISVFAGPRINATYVATSSSKASPQDGVKAPTRFLGSQSHTKLLAAGGIGILLTLLAIVARKRGRPKTRQ